MPSFENAPWPAQTAAPAPGPSSLPSSSSSSPSLFHQHNPRRRRRSGLVELHARQYEQDEVEQAENDCQVYSGNDVITCFPTADTVFPQHQWATVVWNSRLPQFAQTDFVNVYLYRADSRQLIQSFINQTNPSTNAGSLTSHVNDTWFGDDGANWSGSNITYTYYWVVTRNDVELDNNALTQTHFSAVQTTYADSVLSSMSVTSAASASASSASAASASSASAASANPSSVSGGSSTAGGGNGSGGNGSGNVQSGGSDTGFPHWAIAVIVVLGFLAIATSCILAFFIMRRIRRRNELESNRNSMGSASPMMAHVGHEPGSPLLATAGAVAAAERQSSTGHGQRAPSIVSPDGASTISGDAGPFSGADAAIMADAFRKALRKPDFAGATVEEGDSPDAQNQGELINKELADEGRDIRSVSSSRGVHVETLSDSGDTIHDDHR